MFAYSEADCLNSKRIIRSLLRVIAKASASANEKFVHRTEITKYVAKKGNITKKSKRSL